MYGEWGQAISYPWSSPHQAARREWIQIEFEDQTELGPRVEFYLVRPWFAHRRDRDPRFTEWMKSINRQRAPCLGGSEEPQD